MDSAHGGRAPADGAEVVPEFRRAIRRPRIGPFYGLGLLLTAVFMVILPALYLLLIAGVAWLSYQGIVPLVSGQRATKGRVGGVLAILAVGGTVVFFLLRPLFSARPAPPRPFTLDRTRQPVLFEFVDRLCRLVGAPRPSRIDVDTDANASASFRRGLWSLFAGDLVLTVGLPLVGTLTVRQLGGVLAHELGHFAQGAGMRLTFVIRSVNAWFARVVHERDAWDDRLKAWAERSGDVRLLLLGNVARAGVWLARGILGVLMRVGHAVSCFALRQMEFDADRYEAEVAGADAFESTARLLPVIGVGNTLALQDLSRSWEGKTLVDDLPAYVRQRTALLPEDARHAIWQEALSQPARLFDTHPSWKARIAAARRTGAEGVLEDDRVAAALFRGYEDLCRELTEHTYRQRLGPAARQAARVEPGALLRSHEADARAGAAFQELFGEIDVEVATIGDIPRAADGPAGALAGAVRDLRARVVRRGQELPAWKTLEVEENRLGEKLAALFFWRAGARLDMKAWGLGAGAKPEDLEALVQEGIAKRTATRARCRDALAPSLDRIELALSVLARDDLRALVPEGDGAREYASRWADLLRALQSAQAQRDRVALSGACVVAIAGRPVGKGRERATRSALDNATRALADDLGALRTAVAQVPNPDAAGGTVGAALFPGAFPRDPRGAVEATGFALQRWSELRARALAHLGSVALGVEAVLLEDGAERGKLSEDARRALADRFGTVAEGSPPLPEDVSVRADVQREATLPDQCVCHVRFQTRTAAVKDQRFLYEYLGRGRTAEEARQDAVRCWATGFGAPFCAALAAAGGARVGDVTVHAGPLGIQGELDGEWSGPDVEAMLGVLRSIQEISPRTTPVTLDVNFLVGEDGVADGECRVNGQARADAYDRMKALAWPRARGSCRLRQYLVVGAG